MRKNNCEVIRQELDELMPGESCSASALEHLKTCPGCAEFQRQQTKLRQIVGSLGTVEAPADFDFRLRARLANDAGNSGFNLHWPFSQRAFTIAALLIILATGMVLVRNFMNQAPAEVAGTNQPAQQNSPDQTAPPQQAVVQVPGEVAGVQESVAQRIKTERTRQIAPKNKRPTVAMDFTFQRAEVISGLQPVEMSETAAVFPIDASLQSLKVSLDDGHGNARTISVPTVRFGSQRLLGNSNQFASKGVW